MKLILSIFFLLSCQNKSINSSFSRGSNNSGSGAGTSSGVNYRFFSAIRNSKYRLFKVLNQEISEEAILPDNTQLNSMAYFNGEYVFGLSAHQGSNDGELFRFSNSSLELISNINSSESSNPKYLTVHNNKLYFSANGSSATGRELWSYSESEGSQMVSDFNVGQAWGNPINLKTYNGSLYFAATNTTSGNELRRLNGNSIETIDDKVNGARDSFPRHLFVHDNKLLFSYVDDVSRPNGSTVDSIFGINGKIGAINQSGSMGEVSQASIDVRFPISFNSKVYAACSTLQANNELCVMNGNSFTMLGEINDQGASKPSYLVAFNNKIYFSAYTKTEGFELWSYSETAGIKFEKDIYPGIRSSTPSAFWIHEDKLYFQANDGVHGFELWSVSKNGTVALEMDIVPGQGSSYPVSPMNYQHL